MSLSNFQQNEFINKTGYISTTNINMVVRKRRDCSTFPCLEATGLMLNGNIYIYLDSLKMIGKRQLILKNYSQKSDSIFSSQTQLNPIPLRQCLKYYHKMNECYLSS